MKRFMRGFLIVVSVLNGAAGLVCGLLFLAAPDGSLMQAGALLPVIQELPLASVFFRDFVWIGVAMLLVLGIPNTLAAALLIRQSGTQYRITLVAAALLLAWTGFEIIFMYNVLALAYFAVGILSFVFSVLLPVQAKTSAQPVLPAGSRTR